MVQRQSPFSVSSLLSQSETKHKRTVGIRRVIQGFGEGAGRGEKCFSLFPSRVKLALNSRSPFRILLIVTHPPRACNSCKDLLVAWFLCFPHLYPRASASIWRYILKTWTLHFFFYVCNVYCSSLQAARRNFRSMYTCPRRKRKRERKSILHPSAHLWKNLSGNGPELFFRSSIYKIGIYS